MRIKTKKTPSHFDRRMIKTFLILPKKLQDEWRWLEFAQIGQTYIGKRFNGTGWKSEEWGN